MTIARAFFSSSFFSFEEFLCVVVFHSNVFSQRAIILFKVSKKVFETLKRREGEKELIQKDTHQKPPHIFSIRACCRKRLLFGKGNAAEEEEGSSSVVFCVDVCFFWGGGERQSLSSFGIEEAQISLSI